MTDSKRDSSIDFAKGILIICVVLGHTYNIYCRDFVYLFHVGMFFVISGYCLKSKYTENLAGMKEVLFKRIKGLWIPYVAYNAVFLLGQNTFIRAGLLTNTSDYFLYTPLHSGGFVQTISFGEGVKIFLKSLLFINARPLCGGLWFLGGLFYATAMYVLVQYVLKKKHMEKIHILVSLVFLIGAWLSIKYKMIEKIPLGKQIATVFITEILFTIGTYIRMYVDFIEKKRICYVLIFVYCFYVLLLLSKLGKISIASLLIENPVFYLTSILTGGGMVFSFGKILQSLRLQLFFRNVSYLGQHTMSVLALHLLGFKVITFMQWKIYGGSKIILSLYPVWKNSLAWSLLYLFAGILIPLLIAIPLSKIKVLKKIFIF